MDKLLIIVAHQDDETIGCGGTIKKMSEKGHDVEVIFVTDGKTGIDQRDLYGDDDITSIRMEEAKKASQILGVKKISTMSIPCQEVISHSYKNQKLFHRIISKIRESKPNIVITHSNDDKHRDHRAVSELVVESCWKASEDIHSELGKIHVVDDVWAMEITDLIDVDYVVDVSDYMDYKMEAMRIYQSQEKVIDGINENIIGLAKVRGYNIGVNYGEGFKRIAKTPSKIFE